MWMIVVGLVAGLAGEPWSKDPGASSKAPTAAAPAGELVFSGTLGAGDSQLSSGEWFDAYEFDGRAGAPISVRLVSTAFDPYVGMSSDVMDTIENDDAAHGAGSLIETFAARDGRFKVVVTSYKPGESGAYELRVSGLTPVGATAPKPPPGGVRQDGMLAVGDPKLSSGELYDRWVFVGKKGATVTVRLTSSAFDTYVGLSGPGLTTTENDDAATGEGALVTATLPQDGTFTVTVTSYKPGESGAYVLETTGFAGPGKPEGSGPAPAPSAGGEAALGAQIGAAFQAWTQNFAGHVGAKKASGVVPTFATDLAFDGASEVELMSTLGSAKYTLVASYGTYSDLAGAVRAYDTLVARVQAAPFGFPVLYDTSVHENLRSTYWIPVPTGAGAAYKEAFIEVELVKSFEVDADTLAMKDRWLLFLRVKETPKGN